MNFARMGPFLRLHLRNWLLTLEIGVKGLRIFASEIFKNLLQAISKLYCFPQFYLSFGSKASSDRTVCSWIILIQIHWYTFQAILVFMWKSSGSKAPLTKWTLTVTMMILWLMSNIYRTRPLGKILDSVLILLWNVTQGNDIVSHILTEYYMVIVHCDFLTCAK